MLSKRDVHQHHVRLVLAGHDHRFLTRPRLGDDREPGLGAQQRPQAGPHYRMIVRNEDPHRAGPRRPGPGAHGVPAGAPRASTGTTTLTVVPDPGELRTSSRPPASPARARMPGRP